MFLYSNRIRFLRFAIKIITLKDRHQDKPQPALQEPKWMNCHTYQIVQNASQWYYEGVVSQWANRPMDQPINQSSILQNCLHATKMIYCCLNELMGLQGPWSVAPKGEWDRLEGSAGNTREIWPTRTWLYLFETKQGRVKVTRGYFQLSEGSDEGPVSPT